MARRGFTLLELIVVLGIVGLMLALLIPAIQRVRQRAAAITCQHHLRELALGLEAQRHTNDGRYVNAARVPGVPVGQTRPSLAVALSAFLGQSDKLYRCPADPGRPRCYDLYGLSYEYNADGDGGVANRSLEELLNEQTSSTILLVFDMDPFHGPPKQNGSRFIAYADGHVE